MKLRSSLTYRILVVKSDWAREFEKANIEVKTISIEEKENIEQSISIPHKTFKEFVH